MVSAVPEILVSGFNRANPQSQSRLARMIEWLRQALLQGTR